MYCILYNCCIEKIWDDKNLWFLWLEKIIADINLHIWFMIKKYMRAGNNCADKNYIINLLIKFYIQTGRSENIITDKNLYNKTIRRKNWDILYLLF
jgi:hypothetical protein